MLCECISTQEGDEKKMKKFNVEYEDTTTEKKNVCLIEANTKENAIWATMRQLASLAPNAIIKNGSVIYRCINSNKMVGQFAFFTATEIK